MKPRMTASRKYIISGGGTGGHIFPALAIADEIRKRDPGANILFVGASGRMEMERVPAAGYPIIGLPVEGIRRNIGPRNLVVLYKLINSLIKAFRILSTFKPDIAIGVGGYASGPLLRMAVLKNIPILIQEQNSFAGITNRLLARSAAKICVAYSGMESYFPAHKIIITGNPVRQDLFATSISKEVACKHFGIDIKKPVLLIVGGSLGARTINSCMSEQLGKLASEPITVIWQTGSLYYANIMHHTGSRMPDNIKCIKFIDRMDMAYAASDVIISRAGALTLSEICLLGKPAILIPSPNVAEDHQTKNALALVQQNAAVLVRDQEAAVKMIPEALKLLRNIEMQRFLAVNCAKMALPDAAQKIADEVFKILNDHD